MKLSAWAKANGLTYKTAWRMWRDGKLPIPAEQLATGTVVVQVESFSAVLELALRLPKDDRRRLISEIEKSL
jgi:predicted site-specific integrase-resolvase